MFLSAKACKCFCSLCSTDSTPFAQVTEFKSIISTPWLCFVGCTFAQPCEHDGAFGTKYSALKQTLAQMLLPGTYQFLHWPRSAMICDHEKRKRWLEGQQQDPD